MPKLSQSEAVRLYKNKEMVINTFRGTLLTAAPWYYDVANWTATFTNDFTDVANTIKDLDAVASWATPVMYAKGSYDTVGVADHKRKDYDPGFAPNTLYYQGAASELWLGICNPTIDTGNHSSSIESMRQIPGTSIHDVEDGSTVISEGFAQTYGMWECKAKLPPSFRSDTAVAWPSFWMYSNRWELTDRPPLELDVFEIYQSSADNAVRGDGTYHTSMHTHDTPKALLEPGFISRDYNTSMIMGMNPNATFGAASNFDWGDAFHLFQILITPEWFGIFLDGIEITRHPALDAYHQDLYMLLSHQVNGTVTGTGAKAGVTGFITDVMVWLKCDWIKCWQNPDWANLAIGGTADVKTVTTGLTWASYAARDGQIISGHVSSNNLTTTPTLNANGLGAKVIKKYSDFANNPPWTGSLIALDVNDMVSAGAQRHNFKWSNSDNCWILLNPANPFKTVPTFYVPGSYVLPQKTVPIETVEGIIMSRWNKLSLLPDDHTGKDQDIDTTLAQPRVVPNRSYTTVVTKQPGDLVGTCPIANTPAVPARASWSGSSNYRVDPATGSIYIATGANLVEGTDTGTVSFWSPGIPQIRGANECAVTITVQPNVPFDLFGFFGANLAAAWEFDKTANLTLSTTKIATIADSSGYGLDATQSNDALRPTYSATGLNGFPALVSTLNTDKLTIADPAIPTPLNAFGGLSIFNDGSAGVTLNLVSRHCESYDFTQAHSIYFEWNSLEVFCWINGSPVTVTQQPGTINTSGWAYAVGQFDAPVGTSSVIYAANETDGSLILSINNALSLNGKLGIVAIGKTANTTVGRDKLIADGMWRYGIQSLLPIGHTYKNTAPTLYG
jgi:hypothetical protein